MTSKRQRRMMRKAAAQNATSAQKPDLRLVTPPKSETTTQPTPERRARGHWHVTKDGMQDKASDMIGRLAAEGKLTAQQAESARVFQEARAAYVAELGTTGYRSCLAGGTGGTDSGDGNPEAIRAYRRIENAIGHIKAGILRVECDKLADEHPRNLEVLRNALNCMGWGE